MLNRDRLERAQERMREQGIDAYLILTHDDYIYFFGEDRFQPRAIIPAMGPPIIVTFQGEEEEIRQSLGVEDARIFGTVGQQIKDVVGVMREMSGGKESMTVGVQMWFNTPAFLLNLFQRANPDVKVVDIASVMDELRVIKDEAEVELMRKAAQIAAVGIETAAAWLKPGITENEVGAEIEYAMRKAGGQGVATPVFVNSGVRSGWLHGTTSHKEVQAGDLVVVDVVPRYQGYCANMTRTFVIGPPTPKQLEMFDTYKRAQAAGIEASTNSHLVDPGSWNQEFHTKSRPSATFAFKLSSTADFLAFRT
jgi:Xaa-Pro aminopeptidase